MLKSRNLWIALVALVVLYLLPLYVSGYVLGLLTVAYYYAVAAMAWDLLFGFAGEVNFGPSFLVGLGAYTAAMLNHYEHAPIWLCLIAGGAMAVVGGVVLAVPALRLRGPYFGLVTLVAVLLLQNMIVLFAGITGGEIGLDIADVLSLDERVNYFYALGFMTISGTLLFGLSRSTAGLILQASGQNAVEAAALGFNVAKHKMAAFCISALFSGLAGAMLVFYLSTVSVGTVVDIAVGVQFIIAAVLGGRRTIIGAAIGSIFLIVAGEVLRPLGELSTFVVSAVALLVILFFPGGFLGALRPQGRLMAPLLEVAGLTKRFGGLVAVKEISLAVAPGEILGLIGPNGSGKSTVMKCIMGIERPNAGRVRIAGIDVAGWPTHRIARQGVGIVFQHSHPLPRQTVLEHIEIALLPDSLLKLVADRHVAERARAIAARVGLERVMQRLPRTLPFADLRRLELAKAIARNPKVVLVDEPFAGLTATEVGDFSALIASFRAEGHAVLLVDHNVKGVAALVDRVFAMYLGERVAEGSADEVMRNETVRAVYLGGKIEAAPRPARDAAARGTLLRVENLSVSYGKAQALEDVSLHIGAGEFVSVVGLNGAGKTTLFNAICGLVPGTAGGIHFDGTNLRGCSPARIAREGLVQCPESRELFSDMTVRENLDLGGQHLSRGECARQLAWLFELFPILQSRQRQAARTLSGGEQQMLAIARALMMQPKLLILDEPTLGLAPVILEQLSKALDRLRQITDITVLLGEQNVTFALPHADRVYVLEHARIVWEGTPERFAAEAGTGYL